MKKIAFQTFGCKLNFSETSSIAKSFISEGYEVVNFKEEADIYVINSCTVTSNAEKKCKTAIKQANKRNPNSKIAIIGCFSQLRPDELANLEGVDIILGNKEKFHLLNYVEKIKDQQIVDVADLKTDKEFFASYSLGDRTRSFLKVQDGCDYFCSYCTIPFARGRSRSDTIENTVKTAKEIAQTNIKEIILTGVNVGDFGKHQNEKLIDLLKELDRIDGIERIRISSIEPDLLTHEIIEFVARSNKFLPHFHIPLQSGSNDILKTMKRKYKRELFADRVEKIKSLIPDCMIAADVIVGFPGESEELFTETYEFIRDTDINYAHVFSYSTRPGTLAAKMENKVPPHAIKERSKKLHELSERKKQKFYLDHQGKTFNVLFESENNQGFIQGFTENYIRVKYPFEKSLINQIVSIKLEQPDEQGIFDIKIIS